MARGLLPSLAVALLIGALVAGCAGSSGATAGTSPKPSPLPPGTYASRSFQPAVTFTLPAGWENPSDASTYFQLQPAGSDVTGIHLFRDPRAASQDASCPTIPEASIGTLSTDLATWIRARPGLVVSNPKLVTVGGLRGVELDIGIVAGWTASCPFANGAPTVPLFVGKNGEYRWVIAGNERLRLDLLDVPGGGTVVVDVDAFDGTLFAELLNAADPIVRAFSFAAS